MLRILLIILFIAFGAGHVSVAKPTLMKRSTDRLRTVLKKSITAVTRGNKVLTAALVASTLALATPQIRAEEWQPVDAHSARHLRSSFYLLLDAGGLWRVMHVEYIGINEIREPLFVGLYAHTIIRSDTGKVFDILDEVEASLVGYDGLVAQSVELERKQIIEHPERSVYDLLVLTIRGADMRNHQKIEVEPWPETVPEELEMLSYRIDLPDNGLGFFGYPALRRDCVAGGFFVNQHLTQHSCVIPKTSASVGSPIFVKENGALVAFQFGDDSDGVPYAIPVPPELVAISDEALSVDAGQKSALTWGEIKSRF